MVRPVKRKARPRQTAPPAMRPGTGAAQPERPRRAAAVGASESLDGGEVMMVRRSRVAPCVTCGLCGGILRDATTISECLHSFCRKCIFQKLEDENIKCCPTCTIDLGCAPLEKLRADHSLLGISLMMFPAKRRKFEEILLPHPALVSLHSPSRPVHEGDPSAKKTDAYMMGEPMKGETEREAAERFGMEPTAYPTIPIASSPHTAVVGVKPASLAPSSNRGNGQGDAQKECAQLAELQGAIQGRRTEFEESKCEDHSLVANQAMPQERSTPAKEKRTRAAAEFDVSSVVEIATEERPAPEDAQGDAPEPTPTALEAAADPESLLAVIRPKRRRLRKKAPAVAANVVVLDNPSPERVAIPTASAAISEASQGMQERADVEGPSSGHVSSTVVSEQEQAEQPVAPPEAGSTVGADPAPWPLARFLPAEAGRTSGGVQGVGAGLSSQPHALSPAASSGAAAGAFPDIFDDAHLLVEGLRAAMVAREVLLSAREAAVCEAEELFAARLRAAEAQHRRGLGDLEQQKAAVAEVLSGLEKDRLELEEREEVVSQREEVFKQREAALEDWERQVRVREEQVDLREADAETVAKARADGLAQGREERLAHAKRIADLEERQKDWALMMKKLTDRVAVLEVELKVAEAKVKDLTLQRSDGLASLLMGTERTAEMMRSIFERTKAAMEAVGLGTLSTGGKGLRTLSHLAFSFHTVAERVEQLPAIFDDLLTHEGRQLAEAVAEHILACFRSRHPELPLDVVLQGVAGEDETGMREAVRPVAKELAQLFTRDTGGTAESRAKPLSCPCTWKCVPDTL